MKGKENSLDIDVVIIFQLFNTPGTEIAPGSDEIGEKMEGNRFGHGSLG
jgi:hypothetical protein